MRVALRPSLYRTTHFILFLIIAFINAFVDLGHKIIIQNTVFKIYDDNQQVVLTALINALILLPFILSFTPSGFLADRFAKPRIMQWAAFMTIILTLFITFSYYQGWFIFAFCMTFLLALQSAIYSPAKYGYIRELVGDQKIAHANGLTQATSIVAILSGIVLFSVGFEHYLAPHDFDSEQQIVMLIAPLGWLLVILSLIEFLLALGLPDLRKQKQARPFNWQQYRQGQLLKNNVILLRQSPLIWLAILALSLFWGVSQTVLATFPAFAKLVLHETNTIIIQGLLACAGIGIIIGSVIAGKLTNHFYRHLITIGALGQIIVLSMLPQLADSVMFAIAIICFGLFGGLFIVPLNTLIQHHAPISHLGTILAGNNWLQNMMMLTFLVLTMIAALFNFSSWFILISLPLILSISFLLLSLKISDITIKLDILD
ncbi:MAG: MFS transporter [Gammaproteobacteria bacterium]|nr:MFS transporter [Gammaproteobacteria bacterium]